MADTWLRYSMLSPWPFMQPSDAIVSGITMMYLMDPMWITEGDVFSSKRLH